MPEKNGMDLVLYYYPYSFYSQKVVMALHQMQIRFRQKMVDIHKGKQFTEPFLALNPKGEVPVLVDDVRVIPGSGKIIEYLEDNFSNGNPGLLPNDRDIRTRVEQLHNSIHELKIEPLSFGAAMFDDLGIHPKPPYNCMTNRAQMKDYLEKRPKVLRNEIVKHPMYADKLKEKLRDVQEESNLWTVREDYEGLLLHIEKVMDECEAELASHDTPGGWLCSPEVSIADVDLSLLLYRLWQLGFERRMWEKNRPQIKLYFARVRLLDSFQRAITMTETDESHTLDFFTSPVFLGLLGTSVIVAGGYYLWINKDSDFGSVLRSFFNDDNKNRYTLSPGTPVASRPGYMAAHFK